MKSPDSRNPGYSVPKMSGDEGQSRTDTESPSPVFKTDVSPKRGHSILRTPTPSAILQLLGGCRERLLPSLMVPCENRNPNHLVCRSSSAPGLLPRFGRNKPSPGLLPPASVPVLHALRWHRPRPNPRKEAARWLLPGRQGLTP